MKAKGLFTSAGEIVSDKSERGSISVERGWGPEREGGQTALTGGTHSPLAGPTLTSNTSLLETLSLVLLNTPINRMTTF